VPPPNGSQHTLRSPSRQNSFESRGLCTWCKLLYMSQQAAFFQTPVLSPYLTSMTYTLTAVFFLSYSPKLALINVCHSDTSEFLLTAFIFRNRQSTRSAGIVQMQPGSFLYGSARLFLFSKDVFQCLIFLLSATLYPSPLFTNASHYIIVCYPAS